MVTRVTVTVRPARREDAITMARLAQLAYAPYVSRVGREPAPMKADYAKIIDDGYAWVAERHDRLVGLLVSRRSLTLRARVLRSDGCAYLRKSRRRTGSTSTSACW